MSALSPAERSSPVAVVAARGIRLAASAPAGLLGAHWLTDVAYALLSGTAWLTTVITVDGLVRRLWKRY